VFFYFAGSEDRQRIERRSRSLIDAQWHSREEKFLTIQLPGFLDGSFNIQIVENVYAQSRQATVGGAEFLPMAESPRALGTQFQSQVGNSFGYLNTHRGSTD
jgi:hypothetical protein